MNSFWRLNPSFEHYLSNFAMHIFFRFFSFLDPAVTSCHNMSGLGKQLEHRYVIPRLEPHHDYNSEHDHTVCNVLHINCKLQCDTHFQFDRQFWGLRGCARPADSVRTARHTSYTNDASTARSVCKAFQWINIDSVVTKLPALREHDPILTNKLYVYISKRHVAVLS